MENPHMLERPHLIGVLLAACLTLEFGARGDDDLAQRDLKAIQGEWTVPSGFGGDVTYTFKDRSLAIESPNRSYKMTIKVDSKSKPEKSIDFQIDEGPDDAKGKTSKGIYKFDGDDTLTLCFRGEGDRPKEFEQIGFEQIVTKLKRKKAASPKSDEKKPTASERAVEPKAADSDAPLPQGWPAAQEDRDQVIPGLSQCDRPGQECHGTKQSGHVLLTVQPHLEKRCRDDGPRRADL
jgi:uncharacterized protein (TIGR03067 family)